MQFWNNFAAKHPAAAKWVREGGLFVIVSNLITVFKYLLLQFLPAAFSSLPVVDFGWPGVDVTPFGEKLKSGDIQVEYPRLRCRPRRSAVFLRVHDCYGHWRVHQLPHSTQLCVPQ